MLIVLVNLVWIRERSMLSCRSMLVVLLWLLLVWLLLLVLLLLRRPLRRIVCLPLLRLLLVVLLRLLLIVVLWFTTKDVVNRLQDIEERHEC